MSHQYHDEKIGNISVMKSDTSQKKIFIKERLINTATESFADIIKRIELIHPNLIRIYEARQASGTNSFQIYFEEFKIDLDKEIKNHKEYG